MLALPTPESMQTHRGAEFERLGLLLTAEIAGVLKVGLRLRVIRPALREQELAFEPIEFGLVLSAPWS